jgi:hypothetical protein
VGLGTKNDCAGEDQQQFTRLPDSKVASCYCIIVMQTSRFQFAKVKSLCCKDHQIIFLPNYSTRHLFITSKFRGPVSQITISGHPDIFICILLLSERREGEAWEPSHKAMINTISHTSAMTFHFVYSSTIISYLSVAACMRISWPLDLLR